MKKVIFQVEGMSCGHCERAVQTAVLAVPGVEDCAANAQTGDVSVSFDEARADAETLRGVISDTGYTVI